MPQATPLIDGVRELNVDHIETEFPCGVRGIHRLPAMVRELTRLRPSLVHVHLTTPMTSRVTLLAAMLARVPAVVVTTHLVLPPWLESIGLGQRLRQRAAGAAVDRYIAVSESVRSQLHHRLSVPHSKIDVVPNGVAIDEFRQEPLASVRDSITGGAGLHVALVVARLVEQKGHRFLLEAATRLPNVIFLLAGDGPAERTLQQQAQDLGVASRVRFLGYRDDVPALLANCDLFVLPSLFEGLPIAVLEAMAARKPVVATSVGGTGEAVVHSETGLLVPPSDAPALADAIRLITTNRALGDRFADHGHARVQKHFRVERMVQRVAAIYDELVA
jgi:glycosyltransferase involved in cell wall biosynthesis